MICNCKNDNRKLEPATARTLIAEDIASFSNGSEGPARAAETVYRSRAYHEAGHVIAGISFGWDVEYATIGGDLAHVSFGRSARISLLSEMIRSVSGTIAEGIGARRAAIPGLSMLLGYLRQARDGAGGKCDRCIEARYLVFMMGGRSDMELAIIWRDYFILGLRLFDTLAFRFQLHRVAEALRIRTLVWHSDIDALVDADEIIRARRAVFGTHA